MANKTLSRQQNFWLAPVAVTLVVALLSFFIEEYFAYVATSWLIFGLLGLSLSLMWGRAGLLSLGQTAFYGLGGYAGSIAAINFSHLTGNTLIWALPAGAAAGFVSAALIGGIIFYGRMGPLQATILTYVFTLLLWSVAVSFTTEIGTAVIGGDNGLANIPSLKLAFSKDAADLQVKEIFLVVLFISLAVYLALRYFVSSPFGIIIDCIRLDSVKTEFLGYDVRFRLLAFFSVSGSVAGIAGALFSLWANYLNPSVFSVQEALLVPVYVLVGGLGSLTGAFLGSFAVGGLSFWLGGGVAGGQTTLIIGICLIVTVLFFKKGLHGGAGVLLSYFKKKKESINRTAKVTDLAFGEKSLDFLTGHFLDVSPLTLATSAVTKTFGGVRPVNRVSESFLPGKVRCLIGPNGAGKSTFLRCLVGSHKIDSGKITLGEKNISRMESYARVQSGVGIKMQVSQVFSEKTVLENLWVAAYSKTGNMKAALSTAKGMLAALKMEQRRHVLAGNLSHGEKQWLDIGMVLCLRPAVILLDEPAAGMTDEEAKSLSSLMRFLAKQLTVIIVDHNMDFVRSLDADVIVLHQGEIFARGDMQQLAKNEKVLDIYLGRRKNVRNI